MPSRRQWPPLLLLVALAMSPATLLQAVQDLPGSANPRVSLRVDDASAAEAASQLSAASGIEIRISTPRVHQVTREVIEERLKQRASFDWASVTFGQALRQLCARYTLRPLRTLHGTYDLQPGSPAPARQFTEQGGTRVSVVGMSLRQPDGIFDPLGDEDGMLSLALECDLADRDGDTIAGLANLSARDDQGERLFGRKSFFEARSRPGSSYPDHWTGLAELTPPHGDARRLEWLSGDLMVYRGYRRWSATVPIPAGQFRARSRQGQFELDITGTGPDETRRQPAAPRGPGVVTRITSPPDSPLAPNGGHLEVIPLLIDAADGIHSRGVSVVRGRETELEISFPFPPLQAGPSRMVFLFTEKSLPEKLLSFKIENVPMPRTDPTQPPLFAPPTPTPPASPAIAKGPLYQKNGGTLLNRIEFGNRPVQTGSLSLGFSRQAGRGWSETRWIELPVQEAGVVRLHSVKPGTYRLRRIYQRVDGPPPATAGNWLNSDVRVKVSGGRLTEPPPLRWEPK